MKVPLSRRLAGAHRFDWMEALVMLVAGTLGGAAVGIWLTLAEPPMDRDEMFRAIGGGLLFVASARVLVFVASWIIYRLRSG